MGAWGEGLFENDSAADLVGAVAHGPSEDVVALIDGALAAVLEPEDPYLEVGHISEGLAAVALLVAVREPTVLAGSAYPEELPGVLAAASVTLDPVRGARARAVLDRALAPDNNEWYELWDEADEIDDATAPIHRLRALLP